MTATTNILFHIFQLGSTNASIQTDHITAKVQGSYGQGILRESGKTERVREKSGNFKILLTRPVTYALFSQFLSTSGGSPQTRTGAPPL